MPQIAVGTAGFLARLYDGGGGAAELRGEAAAAVGRDEPATAEYGGLGGSRSSERVHGLPLGPGTGGGPSLRWAVNLGLSGSY